MARGSPGAVLVNPLGQTPNGRVMVAQVPTRGVRTLYASVGDLFGWLCTAGLLAAILAALTS